MKPIDLNLPDKFKSFRPQQLTAIGRIETCKKPFLMLSMPAGSGKSLSYVAGTLKRGGRTLFLTRTKQLQDQIRRDFKGLIVDVRGKQNYVCVADHPWERMGLEEAPTVDKAPCELQEQTCELKAEATCLYYAAVDRARNSQMVSTNYHFAMSQSAFAEGLGKFDNVVMDEAHMAGDTLCGFLRCCIKDDDFVRAGCKPRKNNYEGWKEWASKVNRAFEKRREDRQSIPIDVRKLWTNVRKLNRFLNNDWIIENVNTRWGPEYHLFPVWPGPYLHLITGNAGLTVLTSATITRKTVELLGIVKGEFDFREIDSTFDKRRRPLYVIPSARMTSNMGPELQKQQMDRMGKAINRIMKTRKGKGLIHSVSYSRAVDILNTVDNDRIFTHGRGAINQALDKLTSASNGKVLVTPSAEEGVDLPYDQCEFQIIAKVPFPDMRDAVTKARTKDDETYPFYVIGQRMAQKYGRIMRAEDDQGETFLLDSTWQWARQKCLKFIPKWFWEAEIPLPNVPKKRRVD